MDKDFFFKQVPNFTFDLGPAFATSHSDQYSSYLVANSNTVRTEVYAPEINFYIVNSEDSLERKKTTIQRLYAIRASLFDACQQTELTVNIGRRVVIVAAEDQSVLTARLAEEGFTTFATTPDQVTSVRGSHGQFSLSVSSEQGDMLFETDQILWFDGPRALTRRHGIFDTTGLSLEKTIDTLLAGCGSKTSRNSIHYATAICQFHHRRSVVCGQCAAICPTGAIFRHDGQKELEFSAIDCIDCGRCVASCPTGAIDYATLPRAAFLRIANIFKNNRVLVLAGSIDLKSLQVRLAENVMPLVLDSADFLDESHFLTLLQSSGYPLMLASNRLSPETASSVTFINSIFQKKYGRPAIFFCQDGVELTAAMNQLSPFSDLAYDLDERSLSKREIVAKRLGNLVGNDDYGKVSTDSSLSYGSIAIDNNKCTLCLSCADACNTGALTVHPEDNTLRFTAGLCTVCNYCQTTCPEEDCLRIERDQLVFSASSFNGKVMAQDEIFKCVECGVGFAPVKAVTKIASVMEPLFGNDHVRKKALYCCPDCKPKVMLQALQTENIIR